MVKNLPAVQEIKLQSLVRKLLQPTPVLLSGESHEQRSLAGYSSQGCIELDKLLGTPTWG